MKRRLIYGAVVAMLLVNVIVGTQVYVSTAKGADKDAAYPNLELFTRVLEQVRKNYVDGEKLTYQELIRASLKGMVSSLDPHSEFMVPDQFKELQDDTQGSFGGLGIVIQSKDNFVTVVTPIEDTPGFRAGIISGDRIIKIDGRSTEKMVWPEPVKYLRGEPGTEVTVTTFRPSTKEEKEYKLMRAEIKVDTVKDVNGKREFPLGENKIGYVRITQFGEKTSDDLEDALQKLKKQGMQGFILDLRWNPGGLLDQAVDVCEKFLPRGQLVVTTEGRNLNENRERRAMGHGDQLKKMPMVVLANYSSASAAEIVTGCLQDLKRAIVVGEKTFGKGSVQSILPFDDGSALRLTTAKYYTPSHKVIHEHGIEPNIEVPMTDEEERAVAMRRTPGGLETLEPKDREAIKALRDPQLDRATDLLKGIMLFTLRHPDADQPARSSKMAAAEATAEQSQ